MSIHEQLNLQPRDPAGFLTLPEGKRAFFVAKLDEYRGLVNDVAINDDKPLALHLNTIYKSFIIDYLIKHGSVDIPTLKRKLTEEHGFFEEDTFGTALMVVKDFIEN